MGRNSQQRRVEKRAKDQARQARRTDRRRSASVPSLLTVSDQEFLDLIPRSQVEGIVGSNINWAVFRTPSDIRSRELISYNTSVFADRHYRYRHLPLDEKHPLSAWPDPQVWTQIKSLAEQMGVPHNQVLIEGTLNGDECVSIHLASIFPNTLFISDFLLANTKFVASRPMGIDQRHPGLGHGVFLEILERLKDMGRRLGFDAIRGYAVDSLRAAILQRKGFQIDDLDKRLLAEGRSTGRQIPLIIPLNQAHDESSSEDAGEQNK